MAERIGDTYKYYLFESYRPVRVTFNKNGDRAAAQAPDAQSQGLIYCTNLISRMDREGLFDEIDKAAFEKLCDEEYAKKPTDDPPAK